MSRIFGGTMTVLAGIFLSMDVLGQYAIPPEIRTQVAMNHISSNAVGNPGNVVYGLAAPPGRVVGDVYLDPEWHIGSILLASGVLLEHYNIRYDLQSQTLEIQTTGMVRLLDSRMLKTLAWKDETGARYFVNANTFKLGGEALVGVLEVLSDGQKPLFRRATMHVKEPNYNTALDVGSRDAKIYKKTALYVVDGDQLKVVKKGKKGILLALHDKQAEIEAYIDTNKLGTKTDFDVIRIFDYYNSLFDGKAQP